MPELPEVETTRRGIEPFVAGRSVRALIVREARLRWPVPPRLAHHLVGKTVRSVARRAKCLLLHTDRGAALLHLGMSGSLRVVDAATPPEKFDHVDIVLDSGDCLRLRDPRRFGALLWAPDPQQHVLLAHLGPEPFDPACNGDYLHERSRGRTRAIKDFLMDGRIIAGVGNIYANEALFLAGIDPRREAGRVSGARYARLSAAVRATLEDALAAGGTTLRDFRHSDGRPGYFQQSLRVYGRAKHPCPRCQKPIRHQQLGTRSAFFCPRCQT